MEDALHGDVYGVVVAVDRFWVLGTTGWVERLRGSKEGFDSLVPQHHFDEQKRSGFRYQYSNYQIDKTWLNRPITRWSDKVSAIFARPAASEIEVKQFPSLVKLMAALRA